MTLLMIVESATSGMVGLGLEPPLVAPQTEGWLCPPRRGTDAMDSMVTMVRLLMAPAATSAGERVSRCSR